MLITEIHREGHSHDLLLKPDNIQKVLESLNVQTEDDLYAAVGFGHTPALSVVHKLAANHLPPEGLMVTGKRTSGDSKLGIIAGGVDDVAIKRSQCCGPIPGDEVIGYVTRGRGMTLHRKGCPNIIAYKEKEAERLVEVEWRQSPGERFLIGIRIDALDRMGLLKDIAAIFSENKTNIISAKIKAYANKTAMFDLSIEVEDLVHLTSLMSRIGTLNDIMEIRRTGTTEEK